MGTHIVQAALEKGDLVVALARGALDVQAKEAQEAPARRTWTHERCLPLRCDVRLKSQVEAAVKKCIERFGQLDIVVKYLPCWEFILITVVPGGVFLGRAKNKRIMNFGHSLRPMCMELLMLFDKHYRYYGEEKPRDISI